MSKSFRLSGDVALRALQNRIKTGNATEVVDTRTTGEHGAWKAREAAASAYPLVGLCRAAGLLAPVPEYQFHAVRKWRFDYAWPLAAHKVAVEIEGGVWTEGRHTRGQGFIQDMEKYNSAVLGGWRVLRYTPQQMAQALVDLRSLLGALPEAA